ncbi:hypothetical protein DVH05_000015 [Phytophthora capsici]|nr:hypothetical protein DVH05_000015 [Phytophthora capsici]
MCVLRIEENDRYYRLDLIDYDDETEFEKILQVFEMLDVSRRNKCVFQLTVWKNRNDAFNELPYRQGLRYRFERVHSLKLLYGNPLGSMQIRQRIQAEPLIGAPIPGHGEVGSLQQPSAIASQGQSRSDILNTARTQGLQSLGQPSGSGGNCTPPQSCREENSVETLATKSATRRKIRSDGESDPPVKKRKQNPKALSFESPPLMTRIE